MSPAHRVWLSRCFAQASAKWRRWHCAGSMRVSSPSRSIPSSPSQSLPLPDPLPMVSHATLPAILG